MFGSIGFFWQVWFGRFGLVWFGMVVWFGLVYEEDLKRPLVPFKEAKATLDHYLETIPVRVRSVRVCSGRFGSVRSNSDIKADSVQLGWNWD